jgi:hypothetical protein
VAVLIYAEGVLHNNQHMVIKDGLALFRTLQEKYAVIVIAEDKERTDRWLRENKAIKIDNIIDKTSINPIIEWHIPLADYVRSQGPIDFVITHDPKLSADLLEKGYRVLLFLEPAYLDHKFRPDSFEGMKAWDKIKDELNTQADLLLEDKRK